MTSWCNLIAAWGWLSSLFGRLASNEYKWCCTCIIICCRHFYLSTNSMLQSLSIEIHYDRLLSKWLPSVLLLPEKKKFGHSNILETHHIYYTKRTLEYWRDNVLNYPFISVFDWACPYVPIDIRIFKNWLSESVLLRTSWNNLTDNSPRLLYV